MTNTSSIGTSDFNGGTFHRRFGVPETTKGERFGEPAHTDRPPDPDRQNKRGRATDWKEKIRNSARNALNLLAKIDGSEPADSLEKNEKNRRLLNLVELNREHAKKLREGVEKPPAITTQLFRKAYEKKRNSKLMRADFYDAFAVALEAEVAGKSLAEPLEDTLARIAGQWAERGDTAIAPQEEARRAERTPKQVNEEQVARGRNLAKAEMARIKRERAFGVGFGTATLIAAGLFLRSTDTAQPVLEPTARTARFDPSTGEGPDNASPAAMGISSAVPTASFTKQVASERKPVEPEAAGDGTVTLEMTLFDFLNTFAFENNTHDPKRPLGFDVKYYLYSDMTQGPDNESDPLPPGVKPLIVNGESEKPVRVIIKPFGNNSIYDRIFGNLEIYVGGPDPGDNERARDAVAMMAPLISLVYKTVGTQFEHRSEPRYRELVLDPRTTVANALSGALNILEEGTRSGNNAQTLGQFIAMRSAAPPKIIKKLREDITKMFPDDFSESSGEAGLADPDKIDAIQADWSKSPLATKSADILRRIATAIADSSLPRTKEPAQSR